jgi:hypothetical protein
VSSVVYSVANHVASRHYRGYQQGPKYVPESVVDSVANSVAKHVASRYYLGHQQGHQCVPKSVVDSVATHVASRYYGDIIRQTIGS